MPYLLGGIPYIDCLVRKEFTQDLKAGHGEYIEAKAVGVLCVRSDSLQFQVVMKEPYAGCAFLLPIEALVTKPVAAVATKVVQPWDCFSSDFGVCELPSVRRSGCNLVKDDCRAEYRFTLAFTGNDLADDPAQRKLLHVVLREDGLVGAYPNNRCVFLDRALFGDLTAKPEFLTLTKECRAEGLMPNKMGTKPGSAQSTEHCAPPTGLAAHHAHAVGTSDRHAQETEKREHLAPLNGVHSNIAERPDWQQP
jgi:hypothetical protein